MEIGGASWAGRQLWSSYVQPLAGR